MIKSIFMLHSADLPNELPAFERWLLRYHAPEVMAKDIGLQVRFISYRPIPAIPEVLNYGYYNMRVTEVWFRSAAELEELEPLQHAPGRTDRVLGFTWQAPWAKQPIRWKEPKPGVPPRIAFSVFTPATDIFLGGKYRADEKSIIRWYTVMKYPKGVSLEAGEDWFLNTHVKETLQQPGLIAYFSSRACNMPGRYPVEWVRLTELWYEDFNSWKKAVIDSPPHYTKPPWATRDKYPFLEPYTDFASTFILERPDHDYMRDAHSYP
jgi:hypothetical protein